jgi:hypothetical protein
VGFFVVVSLIIARKRVHLDLSTAVFASMVGLVGLVIHCLGMRLIAGGGGSCRFLVGRSIRCLIWCCVIDLPPQKNCAAFSESLIYSIGYRRFKRGSDRHRSRLSRSCAKQMLNWASGRPSGTSAGRSRSRSRRITAGEWIIITIDPTAVWIG